MSQGERPFEEPHLRWRRSAGRRGPWELAEGGEEVVVGLSGVDHDGPTESSANRELGVEDPPLDISG